MPLNSIEGVAHVELLRGSQAAEGGAPDLLVEVPHGADRLSHYQALRSRLVGELPEDLHVFFHMNTDEGAWDCGKATAERIVANDPRRSALLIRSLIPRTFIDCNRPAAFGGEEGSGGLTAGLHVYVKDPADRALLTELHGQYVALVEEALQLVCGRGGLALLPHTYGPRTLEIDGGVDEQIVDKIRWGYAPERVETWPLRAEVDLLTRDGDGVELSPPELEGALLEAFQQAGFAAVANETYYLHPAALGHRWSAAYPGRVMSLEVRRDLIVDGWDPFTEGQPDPAQIARVADVLAPTLERVALRRLS